MFHSLSTLHVLVYLTLLPICIRLTGCRQINMHVLFLHLRVFYLTATGLLLLTILNLATAFLLLMNRACAIYSCVLGSQSPFLRNPSRESLMDPCFLAVFLQCHAKRTLIG